MALDPTLPLSERLLRVNWQEKLVRSAAGVPLLSPEFVAGAGRRVRLVDIRKPEELTGPLGHIPGVVHVPLEELAQVPRTLGPQTPVVLVSNHEDRSGKAAQYLELLGMQFVAALDGGMARWKTLGLSTVRDPAVLSRQLEPLPPAAEPRAGEPLTRERIIQHVGQAGSVRWMRLAAFLQHGRRSCVDGREDQGVIGTPGGDMGEFTLALAAFEQVTGFILTREHVTPLLQAYVDTFGRCYLHNDTPTINQKLIPHLREDERLKRAIERLTEPLHWRAFMRSPPEHVHEALLEHHTNPEHLGCGHLKLMMKDPERYGIRPGLVAEVLRAFWTIRWSGAHEFEYVVLGGEHGEQAVVSVTVDEEPWAFSRVPLLSPSVDGSQVFINHPQVAAYLRNHVAEFLLRVERLLPVVPSSRRALVDAVHQLGQQHLTATLGALAKGLPVFEVRFHSEGFTVQ